MRFELQPILLALWFAFLTVTSHAQQLQFSLIDRSIIMDRVKASPPKNNARERQ
jgi:hypothetical protein